MQYIIYMTTSSGKSKAKLVEANSVKEAEDMIKKKYPSSDIGRISQSKIEIEFYNNKYNK